MKRLSQLAVLVAVASAVPASPLVLAQIQKAAAPAPAQKQGKEKATATVTVEVKKTGDAKAVKAKEAGVRVEKAVVRDVVVQGVLLPAAPGGANANMEPQIRQFMQQFRPAMRAEYYFLLTVASPTPEQRKLIAREGEKALRHASKAYAEAQIRPAQVRNGRVVYPDPRRLIEEEMGKLVRPVLKPDQAARLAAESEKRTADRRHAAVLNFVAKLDGDLILSDRQRAALSESIDAHWDESWCQSPETLLYGDQFYPRLPDEVVMPHLDDRQKDVWNGARTNQNTFFGFVGNMMPQEDPREDKELIEARQAAEREMPMLPNQQLPGIAPVPVGAAAVRVEMRVQAAPAVKMAPVAPAPVAPARAIPAKKADAAKK